MADGNDWEERVSDQQELVGHRRQPSVMTGHQLRLAPNERMRVNLARSYRGERVSDQQELMSHRPQLSVVTGHQFHLAPNERMRVNLVRSYRGIACLMG